MNDNQGYVTLQGVDLRVVVLEATGWTCRQEDWDGLKTYGVFDPNGVKFGSTHYATPKQAWQYAPPVESSVDEALKWLTLDSGCGWVYESPIVDHEIQMHRVCITNWQTNQTYHGMASTAGVAMCRAYIVYKGGA